MYRGLDRVAPYQKINFMAACRMRGSLALVICPKVLEEILAFGAPKFSVHGHFVAVLADAILSALRPSSRHVFRGVCDVAELDGESHKVGGT